ncbi:hypothetical protein [Pantanalinema sp. GBBB05]|uniref:hypothetical protein n=1 Tax=Pantanalinema sp. GBBB05 TaxID=2604139 RepID=UPI001D98686A|nr:hypothetical protein [Pantanalinema sp. GBBB05]
MSVVTQDIQGLVDFSPLDTITQARKRLEALFAVNTQLPNEAQQEFSNKFNQIAQAAEAKPSSIEGLAVIEDTISFLRDFQNRYLDYLLSEDREDLRNIISIFLAEKYLIEGSQFLIKAINQKTRPVNVDINYLLPAMELTAQALHESPIFFPEDVYLSVIRLVDAFKPGLEVDTVTTPNPADIEIIKKKRQAQRFIDSVLLAIKQWEEAKGLAVENQRVRFGTGLDLSRHAGKWIGDDV